MILYTQILILLLLSCETPQGFNGVSLDIKESKERGVFIKEYFVYPNPYKINDSLQITVKEAWLEKQWAHREKRSETFIYPEVKYQLCINSVESDIKGCATAWTIGVDFDKNMRISSKKSLMGDFKDMPGDTIEYQVQKGSELSDNYKKIIIGKFILIERKEGVDKQIDMK